MGPQLTEVHSIQIASVKTFSRHPATHKRTLCFLAKHVANICSQNLSYSYYARINLLALLSKSKNIEVRDECQLIFMRQLYVCLR